MSSQIKYQHYPLTPVLNFSIFLLFIIYVGGLFIPLMDNDSAHHANIALHMYLNNDYVNLIDRSTDYLDKPHFFFWLTALSFKVFGVNGFAYKFPAFLASILAIYSTYKLAVCLTGKTTAKLAAIVFASSLAFILANNDVRMEALLSAMIITAVWQLTLFTDRQKTKNLLLGAVFTAIAFSIKGWLGPIIIFSAIFFKILFDKQWQLLLNPKTWLFIPVFVVCISPVLYAYYLQYDAHPEKVVRGMDNISGIKFILWNQNIERFEGKTWIVNNKKRDYFFFFHSFLWSFLPWSLAAFTAIYFFIKRSIAKKKIFSSTIYLAAAFLFVLISISFSKFKLPHYLPLLFPFAAIFTATALKILLKQPQKARFLNAVQLFVGVICLLLITTINIYVFPVKSIVSGICIAVLTGLLLYFIFWQKFNYQYRTIAVSLLTALLVNFSLNFNFYPQLLDYQGGQSLAKQVLKAGIPDNKIILLEHYSSSFDFTMAALHRYESVKTIKNIPGRENYFYFANDEQIEELKTAGYRVKTIFTQTDYEITKLKKAFINPATRKNTLKTLQLVQIN